MPQFDLKRPCAHCPFRADRPGFLGRSAEHIADNLRHDRWFACHKTVDYRGAFEGQITEDSQLCAGARAVVEKEQIACTALQLAERFAAMGLMKAPAALDPNGPPTFDTLEQFVKHHKGDV